MEKQSWFALQPRHFVGMVQERVQGRVDAVLTAVKCGAALRSEKQVPAKLNQCSVNMDICFFSLTWEDPSGWTRLFCAVAKCLG